MKPTFLRMPGIPAGNGNSSAVPVRNMERKWISIFGTFSCTVAVVGRMKHDSTWFDVGDPATLAVPGLFDVPECLYEVRLNISGYASGQVEAELGGYALDAWQ